MVKGAKRTIAKSKKSPAAKVVARPSKTKTKAKRKPQPRSSVITHSLHVQHPSNIPTTVVSGTATPLPDVCRLDFTLTAGADRVMVFITNAGRSATSMWYLRWAGGVIINNQTVSPTLLAVSASAGGPTTMRAMKMGATLTNTTPILNRGGRVYTLNSDQRFLLPAAPTLLTAADCDTIYNSIVQHPNTLVHDGSHFGDTKLLNCTVVDVPAYENFVANPGALDITGFGSGVASWTGFNREARPMSCVAYVFDVPANAQTYSLQAEGKWYCRFPLNTVAGRVQTPIPTAPPSALNSLLQRAIGSMHTPGEYRPIAGITGSGRSGRVYLTG